MSVPDKMPDIPSEHRFTPEQRAKIIDSDHRMHRFSGDKAPHSLLPFIGQVSQATVTLKCTVGSGPLHKCLQVTTCNPSSASPRFIARVVIRKLAAILNIAARGWDARNSVLSGLECRLHHGLYFFQSCGGSR